MSTIIFCILITLSLKLTETLASLRLQALPFIPKYYI